MHARMPLSSTLAVTLAALSLSATGLEAQIVTSPKGFEKVAGNSTASLGVGSFFGNTTTTQHVLKDVYRMHAARSLSLSSGSLAPRLSLRRRPRLPSRSAGDFRES